MSPRLTRRARRDRIDDPAFGAQTSLLDEAGVDYWVDAGTLLALVRDGRLFARDKDADVGVWSDELDRLGPALERAKKAGRRVARETYRGSPFKFKIYPAKGESGRVLDMQVYRREGDRAWSVVHTVGNYDYRFHRPDLVVRGAVRWPFRMWLAHKAREVEVTAFPWRRIGWLGTWTFPARLVEKTTRKNPFSLPFPDPPAAYLEHRYGDWRTPQREWVYWEHDGAYRPGPPDENLT